MPRIVCISDTHALESKIKDVPEGDILVCAGDITKKGSLIDVSRFAKWTTSLSFREVVIIAGNHDWCFQDYDKVPTIDNLKYYSINYLENSGIEIDGIQFWGSPYSLEFCGWAFPIDPIDAEVFWEKIPRNTEVLITHGPPYGKLDLVLDYPPQKNVVPTKRAGDKALGERIAHLPNLKAHIFGHLHYEYGMLEEGGVKYINCSICDDWYKPKRKPIVIDL